MTDNEKPYEPLTPVQIERETRRLHHERDRAQQQIEAARDVLTAARQASTRAKAALTIAVAKATLLPDCPVMGRGPGEVAAAVRDAWLVVHTLDERERVTDTATDVTAASAVMTAAMEFADQVSDQMMTATSLNKSTTEAYRTSGGPR
jgi:septal ring factor EnvC (AmiA/AmiB activator)